ncbi:hypothetical protein L1K69_23640, partial [Salmonella enterica subsp. enterica serovar Anatum]|nr:hypothetical protein [Salmonella enterica subsp. enterica serovar Anatum]
MANPKLQRVEPHRLAVRWPLWRGMAYMQLVDVAGMANPKLQRVEPHRLAVRWPLWRGMAYMQLV